MARDSARGDAERAEWRTLPGDPNRYIGEVVAGEDRRSYFIAPNVGKEAIALNLKDEQRPGNREENSPGAGRRDPLLQHPSLSLQESRHRLRDSESRAAGPHLGGHLRHGPGISKDTGI